MAAYVQAVPADFPLVVAGATGDLCGRLLLPALARLHAAGQLPPGFRFIGAGPQAWSSATFAEHAASRLDSFAGDLSTATRKAFLALLSYRQLDVLDASAFGALLRESAGGAPLTLYLALPTDLMPSAVHGVELSGLSASVRVALEKPFGSDLDSARSLNAALARTTANEDQVYRVDHILGMPTVQTLPARVQSLRSASAPAGGIDTVSILWEETLALEGRAAFYDRAGALKDLLQNHLLQILCLITMDARDDPSGDRPGRRLDALQAVQIPSPDQVRGGSRRARYLAGTLAASGDRPPTAVPDYVDESGVDPSRATETFAEVALGVDHPGWTGTRFVLRAGKAMARNRRGVLVRFRDQSADDVWIDVDQPSADTETAAEAFRAAPLEQLAYVNVLRDLLSGSNDLSVSGPEAEAAWHVFAPVMQEWEAGSVALEKYPAGTTP